MKIIYPEPKEASFLARSTCAENITRWHGVCWGVNQSVGIQLSIDAGLLSLMLIQLVPMKWISSWSSFSLLSRSEIHSHFPQIHFHASALLVDHVYKLPTNGLRSLFLLQLSQHGWNPSWESSLAVGFFFC